MKERVDSNEKVGLFKSKLQNFKDERKERKESENSSDTHVVSTLEFREHSKKPLETAYKM